MRTQGDAIAMLRAWRAPDFGQRALREAFLGLLEARPDATRRSCVPGHITASAVVLSADLSQTLLTLHPRVKRWVQLGGHCEKKDATIAAAALREATEESGIDGLVIDPDPIHLDVHPVTYSPASVQTAPADRVERRPSPESRCSATRAGRPAGRPIRR